MIEVVEERTVVVVSEEQVDIIEVGIQGPEGIAGAGLPSGGLTGQVLKKASDNDSDTEWDDVAGGVTDHTLLSNIGTNSHAQIDAALATSATHIASTANPHSVTKAQVGLSNVPNLDTTDAVVNEHAHANQAVLDNTTASFTTADETKLDSVATGATANDTDANLRARATHTGTQTASTISDFNAATDARIAADTTKVNKSGDTMTDDLDLASSHPSDDVLGGTDGTSRLNLHSYQRANYNGFGETIRHFLMRKDAKAMEAYYVPKLGYDVNRNAIADLNADGTPADITQWQPVSWTGSHFEANDHGSNHVHWELEIPDSTGALQGRLEVPFANPTTGVIGLDKTNLRTNLTDLTVRTSNSQVLRLAGTVGNHMPIEFNHDSEGGTTNRRWVLRANSTAESGSNAGTDFQLVRYSDDGTFQDSPIFVTRATGYVGLGTTTGTSRISLASATTAVGGIAFGTDTNLYRSASNELKTDDKLIAALGFDAGDNRITNVAEPSSTDDAATKNYVDNQVAAVIDASPATLNTLNELAAALGDDPNFATTVSTTIGTKLAKSSNLSDLDNVATARTNLGLGAVALLASVNLTSNVTGTLPVANGGTGLSTLTSGNFLTASSSSQVATSKAAPAGAVVGTSDAQTLTNKTIGTTNTLTQIVNNGMGYVNHGATASTARPTGFASITWYGSVEPTNMVNGDFWVVA